MSTLDVSDSSWALLVGDYVLYSGVTGAYVELASDADRQALLALELDGLADRTCDPALLSPIQVVVEAGQWSEVLRQGAELEPQVIQAGCWGTWAQLLEQMRLAALKLHDRHAEARAMHQSGVRALCLGDQTAARAYLARAFRLRQSLNDRDGAAATCALLDLLLGPPTQPGPAAESAVVVPRRRFSPGIIVFAVLLVALIFSGMVWTLKLWMPVSRSQVTPQPTATGSVGAQVITPTATLTFVIAPTVTPSPVPTEIPTPTPIPVPTATTDTIGPPPPTLNQPAANVVSTCASDKAQHTVRFQWNAVSDPAGIKRYELVLSEIAPRAYVYPTKTFTGTQPIEVNLPCNVTYRWRVRAVDGADNPGGWSEERQFTLADKSAPPAPALSAPADAATLDCPSGQPIDVLLKWAAAPDPSGIAGYDIEVTQSEPTATHQVHTVAGTQLQMTLSAACNQSYTWRVRATDSVGNVGTWSSAREFQVKPPPPDLVVEELQTTGAAQIAADGRVQLPIRFVVHNRGGTAADIFTVTVIYAPEGNDPPRWFLPTFDGSMAAVEPLPPDGRLVFSGQLTFEIVEQGKTVDVQVIADSCLTESGMPGHCRVLESDEGNNGSALLRLVLPRLVTATLRPAADATVDSRVPARVYGNADLLVVDGGEYPAEALLRFDLSTIPPGAQIRAATLHVLIDPRWSLTDLPVAVELVQAQETWAEETVNWDNRPALAPLDLSIRPVCTLTVGDEGCQWEITRWVQEWVAGQPHWGMALRSQGGRRVFSSRESANAPRLVIEYVFVPAQGTGERGQSGFGLRP